MTLTLSAIIGWLIVGLVIGGIAHLLVPGRQRVGIILTILIGMVGALVGGIITTALLGAGHVIVSFVVALVVSAVLIAAVSHPRSRLQLQRRRRIRR